MIQTHIKQTRKSLAASLLAFGLGATVMAMAGCGPPDLRPAPTQSAGTTMDMNGDWDDVAPAVRVGASECEMAVVSASAPDAKGVQEFTLVTLSDEPATVRTEAIGDTDPRPVRVWARVGTFGDVARERALLREVERRLTQLRGRDWAPLDP